MNQPVFVFGSNLAGRHGKGAALYAIENHGAIYGQGIGAQGNSYAIPTKDAKLVPLPLPEINRHVDAFLEHAKKNQDVEFGVTKIGTGLSSYSEIFIAPLFTHAPANCILPEGWRSHPLPTENEILKAVYTTLQGRYIAMARKSQFEKKINNMLNAIVDNCTDWPSDKTGRFMGYVQCLLIECCKKTTIAAEREFTRPLFHILYEKQGIAAPPSEEA